VDDPHKPLEVMQSPGSLQLVADWWGQTMASRTTDPEALRKVVIMQRLHESDLAGVCLAQGGYTHLCLPMEFDPESMCVTPWGADPRTEAGELLAPGRFSPDACARLKEALGPYGWAGQYQQSPTSTTGGLFAIEWLDMAVRETMPTTTNHARWTCSWDLAFKGSEGADYVACVVAVREAGTYTIVDGLCERLDFQGTVEAVRAFAERYPQAKVVIEDKANGPAVENVLRGSVRSLELVNPQGGKLARAHAVVPLWAAGAVQVVRSGAWYGKWRDQMRRFPRGSHDDMVDATTQALTHLRPSGGLDSLRKAYGR
jgi:predicted phage terminase large subunit-like protein